MNVTLDSKGFEDIDQFWTAAEREARGSDEESSGEEFAYDTSSTITESGDEDEEEEAVVSGKHSSPSSLSKSLESDLSASLSLHENNEDEDTDAQEGSSEEEGEEEGGGGKPLDDDSNEKEEGEEEREMSSNLSSAKKKSTGGKDKSRRQSRVQFHDETPSKGSRRLSAPASLPSVPSSSLPSSSASSSSSKNRKISGSQEELTIDESSPFFVSGRISSIPQYDEEDEEVDYGNNDTPFDEDSDEHDEGHDSSIASSVRTPASTYKRLKTPSSYGQSTGERSTVSSSRGKGRGKGGRYEYYDTPGGTPTSAQSTPGGLEGDESYRPEDNDDDDDDDEGMTDHGGDTTTDMSLVDTSYMQAARSGAMEQGLSDSEEEEEEEEEGGPRRSRRVTKGQRVQFWKNERPLYNKGRMVGILQAGPTPSKPKRLQHKKKKGKQSKRLFDGHSSDDSSEQGDRMPRKKTRKTFPASQLPSDVTFIPRNKSDNISVWDDVITAPTNTTVIHLNETSQPSKLPITADRAPGKDVVGVAAQSFNVPEIPQTMSGWVSGSCELPPGGIKDAEGVGQCCQVFHVASCQDGSVEVGIAHPSEEVWVEKLAQRIVLKAKDSFYVPPGNIYRLENHSKVDPCFIFWTIIRPLEEAEDVAGAR